MANRTNIPAFSPSALTELRMQAGLSVNKLAACIGADGVDASLVSQWEGGHRGINASNLRALAQALNTTPAALQSPIEEPTLGDLRTQAALTQQEVADQLDIPRMTISQLEAGVFTAPRRRSHTATRLGLTPDILSATPPGQLPAPLAERLSTLYSVTPEVVQDAFTRSTKS